MMGNKHRTDMGLFLALNASKNIKKLFLMVVMVHGDEEFSGFGPQLLDSAVQPIFLLNDKAEILW